MTNFSFNNAVPATNNDPSQDQPDMLINNINLPLLLEVDHIGFNADNGGTHKQTAFAGFSAGTLPAGTPASVAYPAPGIADDTRAQYYWKNGLGTFTLSCIKAYAKIDSAGNIAGGPSNFQQFNITGNTKGPGLGVNNITIAAGTVASTTYAVFVSPQTNFGNPSYRVNLATTSGFQVTTLVDGSPADQPFGVFVIQL